jgi:hypothetical protein
MVESQQNTLTIIGYGNDVEQYNTVISALAQTGDIKKAYVSTVF